MTHSTLYVTGKTSDIPPALFFGELVSARPLHHTVNTTQGKKKVSVFTYLEKQLLTPNLKKIIPLYYDPADQLTVYWNVGLLVLVALPYSVKANAEREESEAERGAEEVTGGKRERRQTCFSTDEHRL